MRFKKSRTLETTLDIVIDDIEARFTSGGKRVARIYAQGLDSVVIQRWEDNVSANDEAWVKLLELPRGSIITVTGRAYKKTVDIRWGERKGQTIERSHFDITSWTDNRTTDEPPANIEEVPF